MIEACNEPQLPPTLPPVALPPPPVKKAPVRSQSSLNRKKLLLKIIVLAEAAVGTPLFLLPNLAFDRKDRSVE